MKILLALLFTLSSFTCEIFTSHKIFYSSNSKSLSPSDFITKTNCSKEISDKFFNIIKNSNGNVPTTRIQKFLKQSFKTKVNILPKKILIQKIEEHLKEVLELPTRFVVNKVSLLKNKNSIFIEDDQYISFSCSTCLKNGDHNIKATIKSSSNDNTRTKWIKVTIMEKVEALISKFSISPHQKLSKEMFHKKIILTVSPANIVTNFKSLKFFKSGQSIEKGQHLSKHMLLPQIVINAGNPIRLKLITKNISLRGEGMAMQSGKFGDTIRIKRNNSNKIFTGIVIDYNKAIIEL